MDNAEFPEFADGDTLLTTADGHVWKLHKFQLARNCPTLHKMFSDGSLMKSNGSVEDSNILYKLLLRPLRSSNCLMEIVSLSTKEDKSHPVPGTEDSATTHGQTAHYQAYNNFFRLLYEMDPELTNPTSLNATIVELSNVLEVAESLGASKVVRKAIEPYLIGAPGFWKHVAESPMYWSDIACRLQSVTIFKEAMCHFIGKFNDSDSYAELERAQDLHFQRELQDLSRRKHETLRYLKIETEQKALTHYPISMHPAPSIGVGGAKRSIYANNIYQWQSLLLIRQWMTRGICKNEHHLSQVDGGVSFYRKLGAGGDAYVDEADVTAFHQIFPMSGKGQEIFRNSIYTIKDQISPLLQPLLVDNSIYGQSLPSDQKLPYLTCITVTDSELPWLGKTIMHQKPGAEAREQTAVAHYGSFSGDMPDNPFSKTKVPNEQHTVYPTTVRENRAVPREQDRHSYSHNLLMEQVPDPTTHTLEEHTGLDDVSSKRQRMSEEYMSMHGNTLGQDHMMNVGLTHMPMTIPSSGVDSALRVTQQRDMNQENVDGSHEASQEAMLHHMNAANMAMHHQHHNTGSFEHIHPNDQSYTSYTDTDHGGGRKRDWHDAN